MAANGERIEGPTPAGGDYAILYRHDDGRIEIVEFMRSGWELRRTYSGHSPPPQSADRWPVRKVK